MNEQIPTTIQADQVPAEIRNQIERYMAEIERLRSWLREIGRNPVAPTPNAIEKLISEAGH